MKIRKTIKTIGTIIVGTGVGMILKNIVDSTTPESTNKFNKTCIGVGAIAVTAMLTDKMTNWTEKAVDKVADGVEQSVENGDLS